jgi:hypothetical protein
MITEFTHNDLILGSDLMTLTNKKGEVEIYLDITKTNIHLNIAGRDIEWDRSTGEVHSTGLFL